MDSKYLIGVPEMDEQHATILKPVDRAKRVSGDEFEMNAVVMDLVSYAHSHLDQEEDFLKENGLVDFEKEHSKKHVLFRAKAMEIYDQFRDAADIDIKKKILYDIALFCEHWLIDHINVEDRAYAVLLHKKAKINRQ